MQGAIRIDVKKLAETYGVKDLAFAELLTIGYSRRQVLLLVPADRRVERWLPEEVTG